MLGTCNHGQLRYVIRFFSRQSKADGAELNMVHLTHELGGLHQENYNEYQVLHDLKQQQGFLLILHHFYHLLVIAFYYG